MDIKSRGNRGKKIIIVEDEEVLLRILKGKLEEAGFLVSVARDGATGLELIKNEHPDLVLLDMMLPVMDGFGVLEGMKEAGFLPGIPVLIISNSGQLIETERALELGVRGFLIKVNFDPKEVLARVEALLEGREMRSSLADNALGAWASGKVILIVEDDMLLQELLGRKFIQEGYRLFKAFDVEAARRIIVSNTPDFILLDLVLPGVTGLVFLEELKRNEKTARIPIVVISNLGQRQEVEKGLALGATDYIVKAHISPSEIVHKIGTLLAKEKTE